MPHHHPENDRKACGHSGSNKASSGSDKASADDPADDAGTARLRRRRRGGVVGQQKEAVLRGARARLPAPLRLPAELLRLEGGLVRGEAEVVLRARGEGVQRVTETGPCAWRRSLTGEGGGEAAPVLAR
mmetsp:Transcript_24234/g.66080  ORF Transcript_24234/g.66080 Transcript_24234/m.66080 type:complete len:129 (-) Transcript_24234:108-494(-)